MGIESAQSDSKIEKDQSRILSKKIAIGAISLSSFMMASAEDVHGAEQENTLPIEELENAEDFESLRGDIEVILDITKSTEVLGLNADSFIEDFKKGGTEALTAKLKLVRIVSTWLQTAATMGEGLKSLQSEVVSPLIDEMVKKAKRIYEHSSFLLDLPNTDKVIKEPMGRILKLQSGIEI
jgi:hypothetical protein